MASVAFATFREEPGIAADDGPAAAVLRRAGMTVTPVVWDEPGADWSRFDAVVLRSTWDYFRKAGRFERWVRGFAADGPRLWNPPEVVLWNINKRYLLDLEERGIAVVPTEYLTAAARPDLQAVLERRGWEEAVVKPAVAAGAHGAWRTSVRSAAADRARLTAQLAIGDALVQSFMPEVGVTGEWSLAFLGQDYSHAVLKQPRSGDFRVQEHFGGRTLPGEPHPDLVCQARAAVTAVGWPLLYARVDGVERDGKLLVMELEVTEPSLFLGLGPGAAERFAAAIKQVLS
jgi:hypothetical protein